MNKTYKMAILSLIINVIYGVYNVIMGVASPSWWFLTAGAYYKAVYGKYAYGAFNSSCGNGCSRIR